MWQNWYKHLVWWLGSTAKNRTWSGGRLAFLGISKSAWTRPSSYEVGKTLALSQVLQVLDAVARWSGTWFVQGLVACADLSALVSKENEIA